MRLARSGERSVPKELRFLVRPTDVLRVCAALDGVLKESVHRLPRSHYNKRRTLERPQNFVLEASTMLVDNRSLRFDVASQRRIGVANQK